MRTALDTAPATRPGERRPLARIYGLEFRNELLTTLRMPAYALMSLLFPLLFYLLFAYLFGSRQAGGTAASAYMLATMGSFGVIGAGLFSFGMTVSMERRQGWMVLRRASPMPPLAYFAAKAGASVVTSAAMVLLMFSAAALTQGVRLDTGTWLMMGLIMIGGVLPFSALGLVLGYLTGPNTAPLVINLIYLPLGFLAGLWMPLEILPKFIAGLAPFLPSYHFGQLALLPLGASRLETALPSVLVLAAWTAACLTVGVLLYRRSTKELTA